MSQLLSVLSRVAPILILLAFAAEAQACTRCGLFGNRCKFVAPAYHAPVAVKQYVQPLSTNVYVVQSNYGTPLVPQGNTLYQATQPQSLQQTMIPLLDPNPYFAGLNEIEKSKLQSQAIFDGRRDAAFLRTIELQAPSVEQLSRGQSAAMVLQAANLTAPVNGQNSSQAFILNRNAQGQLQVLPITQEQTQAIVQRTTTTQTTEGYAAPVQRAQAPQAGSFLTTYCGKCHGLNVAQPSGQLYLGNDPSVAAGMKDKFFEITQSLSKEKMPPASEPQPNTSERVSILNEIEALISTNRSGP